MAGPYFARLTAGPPVHGVTGARRVTMDGFAKVNSAESPYCVFNEYITSRLANVASIPVPPGGIVQIGSDLAWVSVSFADPAGAGPPIVGAEFLRKRPSLAARLFAFDVLVGNTDRHGGNVHMKGDRVDVFDHERAVLSHLHLNSSGSQFLEYLWVNHNQLLVDGKSHAANKHFLMDLLYDEEELFDAVMFVLDEVTARKIESCVEEACNGALSNVDPVCAPLINWYLQKRREGLRKVIWDNRSNMTSMKKLWLKEW
jgi:hypothetical protein